MIQDVALEFLVILVAHIALAEGGDFARVLEGAFGIDVREWSVSGAETGLPRVAGGTSDCAAALAVVSVVLQATVVVKATASDNAGTIFNHRARGLTQPEAFGNSIFVAETFIVSLCSLRLCGYDFFSARFLRWVGCTSQAITMLRT